jgi:hypothetical protein
MARKSVEALSVITHLPGQRTEPPAGFPAPASEVWRAVVASKPHDWFTADSVYLLEAYCHAVVSHRLISLGVAAFDSGKMAEPAGVALYDQLTRMQERQARVMTSIATKLRLTQQSRYTPQAAATAAKKVGGGARPWDN